MTNRLVHCQEVTFKEMLDLNLLLATIIINVGVRRFIVTRHYQHRTVDINQSPKVKVCVCIFILFKLFLFFFDLLTETEIFRSNENIYTIGAHNK